MVLKQIYSVTISNQTNEPKITKEEVQGIKTQSRNCTPGPDGILNSHFKQATKRHIQEKNQRFQPKCLYKKNTRRLPT